MNPSITVYNAFTGMSISERQQLLLFMKAHVGENGETPYDLALVAYHDIFPIGCLIVNKTGMEGFGPGHIISIAYQHPQFMSNPEIMDLLIARAMEFTGGDISYYLRPNGLQAEFIHQFKEAINQLHFKKLKTVVAAIA